MGGSGDQAEAEIRAALAPFLRASALRAAWQLAVALALYLVAWSAVAWATRTSVALAALLALPAGALLVRVFILQHDCGHGSLWPGRRANAITGALLGLLTLAPYNYWRKTHATHHGVIGNLDRRGELGYIDLRTVAEYRAMSPAARRRYRIYRDPRVLICFGLPFQFLLWHRLPLDTPRDWQAEWASVLLTDLGLLVFAAVAAHFGLLGTFVLTELLVVGLAAMMGGALFYLQHSFEGAWNARSNEYSGLRAALYGSSRLELPRLLAWLSGDIGLHHVHHCNSQIPNYRLAQAMMAVPALAAVPRLRLADIRRAGQMALYDEERGKLVSFAEVGALTCPSAAPSSPASPPAP